MNYKIRVENEAESKEVQDFAKSDGYSRKYNSFTLHKGWVCLNSKKDILCVCHSQAGNELDDYKEITLPELRDLVVLKRNDQKDANVSEENCLYDLYLTESKELYFYHCGKNKWILSNLNGDDDYYESLKPIEKPMKEYLNKLTDGTYKLVVLSDVIDGHDGLIEIPEGAEIYTKYDGSNEFYKSNNGIVYRFYKCCWIETNWDSISKILKECDRRGFNVLWQRPSIPEELPFVDDEPSINDQYAEIEQVRQEAQAWANRPVGRCRTVPIDAKPNQTTINAMNEADSLIADTLNERQSTYGSFEDVALTTQKIMDAIAWAGGQDKLPAPHHEALHMIASKMARIVNGDHNHKDSWHDIAGYATLVERLL